MKIIERLIHIIKLLVMIFELAILSVLLVVTLPIWIIPYEIMIRTRERKNNDKQ